MTRTPQPDLHASKLLQDIEWEVQLTKRYIGREKLDPRIMEAMASVPRHAFVPEESKAYAYNDGPVPIGFGQTVSQPFMVALMTELLAPEKEDVILEVGTGCGYQTAVLAELVKKVYSIEIISELAEKARQRLAELGYKNVEIKGGDGYYGWPEFAPFDGIIVTAAAPEIPEPLVNQLKPGGNLVIPVGEPFEHQMLKVLTKTGAGNTEIRDILDVAFVPLTGKGIRRD